jgi:hypothetical protein
MSEICLRLLGIKILGLLSRTIKFLSLFIFFQCHSAHFWFPINQTASTIAPYSGKIRKLAVFILENDKIQFTAQKRGLEILTYFLVMLPWILKGIYPSFQRCFIAHLSEILISRVAVWKQVNLN